VSLVLRGMGQGPLVLGGFGGPGFVGAEEEIEDVFTLRILEKEVLRLGARYLEVLSGRVIVGL
jgi:hypothetical protein